MRKQANWKRPKKIQIKAIIFDLGGVVVHGGFLPFIHRYCKACLTEEGMQALKDLERELNLGKITDKQFYTRMRKVFGVHLTPKQMHDYLVEKMKTDRTLVKLIPKLHPSKLALFTNSLGHITTEVLRRRSIPTKKLFDKVFISGQLHMVKPDHKTYNYILKKLKVKPDETLMVDDRLSNIKGAREIGMHGIVYRSATQFKKALKKFELS